MELGQYQLQIFVSLVVILGAAFVALICDFLKGNNEQLRELTIELKVRREEEQKRAHTLTPRVAERAVRSEKVTEKVAAAAPAPALAAPKERVATKERKRTTNASAMAAMERGAALAGSGMKPRSMAQAPVVPAPAAEIKVETKVEVKPEVTVIPAQKSGLKKDWGSLLNRNAQAVKAETTRHTTASSDEIALPAGFHAGFQDGHVLHKLVESRQPITGLVVSIGVNATHKADGALPESVTELVQSLIGPNDFAAQSGEDEFLLIYPQERGASAQRRLSEIAQQLWDFQLRSLGSFQILFSWGGVEVRSESIDEAIASASERMQETKRGRKLLTMSAAPAAAATLLRKAV